jgi:lactoylglutathione lyase
VKIDHIAIWTIDLEKQKDFYLRYFSARASEKYYNPKKKFESYFLTFDSGARLELMSMQGIAPRETNVLQQFIGLTHIAISVGSKQQVDALTEQFRSDGIIVAGEPRTTGDGYYESVVLDPEGNRIEITI